jgi:hypothetical protein
MTIYISGPITGILDGNRKAFNNAQREIKKLFKTIKTSEKVKIINPCKMGFSLDKKHEAAGKLPPVWGDYMRMCIKELCQCDFILLLPGWGFSEGAVIEKYLAERLRIHCVENINELSKLIIKEN